MKDISDKRVNISLDNPSITFDKNKCDECSICKNICKFNYLQIHLTIVDAIKGVSTHLC